MNNLKNTLKKNKYRPYLSYTQLCILQEVMQAHINNPSILSETAARRQDANDAEYIISSLIREINYSKRSADYIASDAVKNADVKGSMLFSEEELGTASNRQTAVHKPVTDHDILANSSEYEKELIFLNNNLEYQFITKEQYVEQLAVLKEKYQVT